MVNIAVVSALIILSFAIILLNTGCLFVVISSKKRFRVSSLFLATLLIIHIIQGVVVIPLYTAKRWKIQNKAAKVAVCDTFRFSYLLTNYLSCITILLISLDRFFAIRFPLKYRVRATKSCALKSIAASWAYVLALCLIPFGNGGGKCNHNPSKIWSISMLSCNTFFPFIIIIVIYTFISRKSYEFVRSCQRRRCIQKHQNLPDQRRRSVKPMAALLSKEFAAAKVAVLIAISYIVCWGPSFVYYMLKNTCPHCFAPSFKDSLIEEQLDYAMKFLTLVDGLAAPVIYCLRNITVSKKPLIFFNSRGVSRSGHRPSSALSTTPLTHDTGFSRAHSLKLTVRGNKHDASLSTPDKSGFSDDSGKQERETDCEAADPSQVLLENAVQDDFRQFNKSSAVDDGNLSTLHDEEQVRFVKGNEVLEK